MRIGLYIITYTYKKMYMKTLPFRLNVRNILSNAVKKKGAAWVFPLLSYSRIDINKTFIISILLWFLSTYEFTLSLFAYLLNSRLSVPLLFLLVHFTLLTVNHASSSDCFIHFPFICLPIVIFPVLMLSNVSDPGFVCPHSYHRRSSPIIF